jgi:hypothetical protein
MVNYAHIKLWDDLVGIVSWNPDRSVADFEYDSEKRTGFHWQNK